MRKFVMIFTSLVLAFGLTASLAKADAYYALDNYNFHDYVYAWDVSKLATTGLGWPPPKTWDFGNLRYFSSTIIVNPNPSYQWMYVSCGQGVMAINLTKNPGIGLGNGAILKPSGWGSWITSAALPSNYYGNRMAFTPDGKLLFVAFNENGGTAPANDILAVICTDPGNKSYHKVVFTANIKGVGSLAAPIWTNGRTTFQKLYTTWYDGTNSGVRVYDWTFSSGKFVLKTPLSVNYASGGPAPVGLLVVNGAAAYQTIYGITGNEIFRVNYAVSATKAYAGPAVPANFQNTSAVVINNGANLVVGGQDPNNTPGDVAAVYDCAANAFVDKLNLPDKWVGNPILVTTHPTDTKKFFVSYSNWGPNGFAGNWFAGGQLNTDGTVSTYVEAEAPNPQTTSTASSPY